MEYTKLPYYFVLHISLYGTNYSASLVLHHVHGEDSFPRNVGTQVPIYTASQPRRTQNVSSLLWKLHNLKLPLKKFILGEGGDKAIALFFLQPRQ